MERATSARMAGGMAEGTAAARVGHRSQPQDESQDGEGANDPPGPARFSLRIQYRIGRWPVGRRVVLVGMEYQRTCWNGGLYRADAT